MATSPKNVRPLPDLPPKPDPLALLPLQRARAGITELHLQLCRIPAPTFFEAERAAWMRDRLSELGWRTTLDRAGNVVANFGDGEEIRRLVISAHLDTVFAPQRPEEIYVAQDGRLRGPGVADNGAGLSGLLALARVLHEEPAYQQLAREVTVVANVGEEGEGNLSGMRYLCRNPDRLRAVQAFIVLDGPSVDHITAQALGSRRYEITLQGPGGHSWNDSGAPNPVHALARIIADFGAAVGEIGPGARFAYNFGIVEGGASINSIPASARAKLDLRSEESGLLERLSAVLNGIVEKSLESENRRGRAFSRLSARIRDLGSRPGGRLQSDAPLLRALEQVDRSLHIRSHINCASTDANVPLSLGLPAVAIGAGGTGGGAHTPDEWYSPDGRELGLQRVLLLLQTLTAL